MSDYPTLALNPKYHYCAGDFKPLADYGAASTHGGNYCYDCKHRATLDNHDVCNHPLLAGTFVLGTYPERMGCRNAFEAKDEGRAVTE